MHDSSEVLFDGDCGLCRACASWLLRKDKANRLTCTPASECTWPHVESLPLAQTVLIRTSDGTISSASTAVAQALSELSGVWGLLGRWVIFLNRSRALLTFHDSLYYWMAKRRHRISRGLVRLHLLGQSCLVTPLVTHHD